MLYSLGGPSSKVGSSAKFCVAVFKASMLDLLGGPLAKVGLSAKFGVAVFKASMLDLLGGPSAKVGLGLSAKFGVAVFKASMLNSLGGGPSAKVCSSAKFCVLVFKANITCQSWNLLLSFGGYIWHDCTIRGNFHLFLKNPLAKVGSSAKFGVAVFKASMLDLLGGSISQSRFVCQVWCSSIQGIYAWFTAGCPSAKVCSSAKFCALVFKANITCQSWNLLLSFGGVLGVSRGLNLTWLYNANWLFTTIIIQKYEEISTFLEESICQSRFICQVWGSSIQGIYAWFTGGPLAKVGSSAKFGVAVFKASMLDLLGGSIGQSRFVSQVWCSSI